MRSTAVRVMHTRVFQASSNGGNPCPVVASAKDLTDSQKLAIARRFGLDTAFIEPASAPGAHIKVRYFVPDHEMGISGHASIAAITVAFQNGTVRRRKLCIETMNGCFDALCDVSGNDLIVTLEQNAPEFFESVEVEVAAHVLRVTCSDIADGTAPVQVVSTSRPKLLVPLKDRDVLNALSPDFAALWALCEAHRATGLYAFTRLKLPAEADAEARQFPVRAGFAEDAATGVAAGALGAYIVRYDRCLQRGTHHLRIAQGYAMGAVSRIDVIIHCENGAVTRTAIRGAADIIGEEEILL